MQKFKTKHEVFDYISNLREGLMVLILDEGHYDSLMFLNALFSEYAKEKPVVVLTAYDVLTNFKQVKIDVGQIKSLSDLSIFVNRVRNKMGQGVIIHHYLPQLLVQQNEALVLRMIEHWLDQIHGKPFVEFLNLPRGTFPTFEKTLQVLLPGYLDISYFKTNERYHRNFAVYRICDMKFHGVEFPYIIDKNKLLIKFEDEFTDKIPVSEKEKIMIKKNFLERNVNRLKIVVKDVNVKGLPPREYLLLTQLHNMHLMDVRTLFPEEFDSILEKIAGWIAKGIARVEETVEIEEKPPKKFNLITRIGLKMPNWIALYFLGKKPRLVPRETLVGLRKTVQVILSTYLPEVKGATESLELTERFIQEIVGRITAVERVKKAGEDPRFKFDLRYLPKIVSLTLHLGFNLKCKIEKKEENTWVVTIKDCFLCEGIKSNKPVCHIISGTLTGGLSQSFKEKIVCEEIKCKAMGDKECIFLIKKY